MACARKCDICGKYYSITEADPYETNPYGSNTSMVRLMKLKPEKDRVKSLPHDVFHFDACDECLNDVMDFILSKRADSTVWERTYQCRWNNVHDTRTTTDPRLWTGVYTTAHN